MSRKTNKVIIFFLILTLLVGVLSIFAPVNTLAQEDNTKNNGFVPISPVETPNSKNLYEGNLSTFLNNFIRVVIGVAIGLAVIMISIGGIMKMSSDSIYKQEQGNAYVKNAIWGLILAIVSGLILITINPELLNNSLEKSIEEANKKAGKSDLELNPENYFYCYEYQKAKQVDVDTTICGATDPEKMTNVNSKESVLKDKDKYNSDTFSKGVSLADCTDKRTVFMQKNNVSIESCSLSGKKYCFFIPTDLANELKWKIEPGDPVRSECFDTQKECNESYDPIKQREGSMGWAKTKIVEMCTLKKKEDYGF